MFFLGAGHNFACGVKDNKARARGPLVNGSDVVGHGSFPPGFLSSILTRHSKENPECFPVYTNV
jgi:hypothetical protein